MIIATLLLAASGDGVALVHVRAGAPPGGDGTSWATAYDDVQTALDAFDAAGDPPTEMRIAQGVYRPSQLADPLDPRSATFYLRLQLTLRGGYVGTGPDPDAWDPAAYRTYLDGDIGVAGSPFDNAWHVVTASFSDASTILEGFVVRNGRADGSPDRGAGLRILNGSPVIRSCEIRDNYAAFEGAGAYVTGPASFTDCRFEANVVDPSGEGGGGAVSRDAVAFRRCVFRDNSGGSRGGGLKHDMNASLLVLEDCVFDGNTAGGGAALAVGSFFGTLSMRRCTLFENVATNGAVLTFASVSVEGSILWANVPGPFHGVGGPTITVSYSDVQGGWAGTGNIAADPQFVDAASGDLRLAPSSPCVDVGAPSSLPLGLDAGGMLRVLDGDLNGSMRIDMGAHERSNVVLSKSGPTVAGSAPTLRIDGKPGLLGMAFASLAGATTPCIPFGVIQLELTAQVILVAGPAAMPFEQAVVVAPDPAFRTIVHLQAIGLDLAAGTGNLSNPVVTELHDAPAP